MARRIDVTGADGVRLAAWEFCGPGEDEEDGRPAVLLLHGLMGRGATWARNTVPWLVPRFRTVALDQRGHGRSDKPAGPYDRAAYLADAEAAVEQLGLAPVVLIGHSMGALTAWQLAARRPDLVRAVVCCDMRASALGEGSQREWREWFASWPLPFDSLAAVRGWFAEHGPELEGVRSARGEYFTELMEEHDDGWRPGFSVDHMLRTREAYAYEAHWDELARVHCPSLVVRGTDGMLGRAEAHEMVRVLAAGRYAEVQDAGHLVHWDNPDGWRQVVEPYLWDLEDGKLAAGEPALGGQE
ncbi:alpha/beta hydrolase [Streptomyces capparidis]